MFPQAECIHDASPSGLYIIQRHTKARNGSYCNLLVCQWSEDYEAVVLLSPFVKMGTERFENTKVTYYASIF